MRTVKKLPKRPYNEMSAARFRNVAISLMGDFVMYNHRLGKDETKLTYSQWLADFLIWSTKEREKP